MLNALIGVTIIGTMIAMGLELSVRDFRRVAEIPRAAVTGFLAQMLLLPALAFGLALALGAAPAIATGMVILAACPGGPPSNVLSYLAGAHIALSVTLTAISSLATVLTVPFIVNLGLATFYDASAHVRLPIAETLAQLTLLSVLPIALGIYLRARFTEQVERLRAPIKRCILALFFLTAFAVAVTTWREFVVHFRGAAVASTALSSCALAMGWGVARLAGLDERDRVTIGLEVGVQNLALASLIVLTQLERPELIVLPSAYAVVSLPSAAIVALLHARRTRVSAAGAAAQAL